MSETVITEEVLGRLNDMGDGYIYNDSDFISPGEPQNNVSGTDLSAQLSRYVSKNGDSMIGNLMCPTVQINSIQFSDNTIQSTAVDNTDVSNIKTATQQISYSSDASGSTYITNLKTGNFNTSYLSGITEDVQNSLNTLKTKTTGMGYINSQTIINNLNAYTLTAGNFNTSHLSNTISNVQGQINVLKTNTNNLIYNTTNILYDINYDSTSIRNLITNNFNTSYLSNITSDVQTQFNTLSESIGNISNVNIKDNDTLIGTIQGSSGNQINYTNNINNGNHTFITTKSGSPSIPLTFNSDRMLSNVPILLSGLTNTARTIASTFYAIYDKNNINYNQIGSIESSDNNININYSNNISNGSHNFYANNNVGMRYNPLSINSNGISLNEENNYIQFPDNTKQYTSAITSTYTKAYTTNQTVNIPPKCYKIDLSIIGPGGNCGAGRINAQGQTLYGGTGGGGQHASTTMMVQPYDLVSKGTQFTLQFVPSTTTFGYVQVNWEKASNGILAKVLGGNVGGDATTNSVGNGAGAGSVNPTFDSTYTFPWYYTKSTAGSNGTISPTAPSIAGAPANYEFINQDYGMGRLQFQTEAGLGVVMITYYVNV